MRLSDKDICVEGEEKDRQPDQVRSLLKTLYLLSSVRVNVYVFNNDDKAFFNILAGVREWHVETESRLIFHNVKETGPESLVLLIILLADGLRSHR